MKRLLAIFLALTMLFALASCGSDKKDGEQNEEDSNLDFKPFGIEDYQNRIDEASDTVGVAYLGFYDETQSELIEFLNKQRYWEELILLEDIPQERIVNADSGYELYLILPAEEAVVTVYECIFDENSYEMKKGKELYKSAEGEPFFVKGNVSDIVPTYIISAKKGGKTVEYSPCLSLKDGKLNVNVEGVYDMTAYDYMSDFIYEG